MQNKNHAKIVLDCDVESLDVITPPRVTFEYNRWFLTSCR